jgi:alkanesulfonate monooxygenase SsuD/methylene tetrahydromethanopterin reductase-like flavin-dependent oxidoreductase (luciferase family)
LSGPGSCLAAGREHPAAWRSPDARPQELFSAGYWTELAREADAGALDFLTIEDSLGLQTAGRFAGPDDRTDQVRGRLDAVLTAPWTNEDRTLVSDRVETQFAGSPATVAKHLRVLQDATNADELLVTTVTHSHADRVRSFELLARAGRASGRASGPGPLLAVISSTEERPG